MITDFGNIIPMHTVCDRTKEPSAGTGNYHLGPLVRCPLDTSAPHECIFDEKGSKITQGSVAINVNGKNKYIIFHK